MSSFSTLEKENKDGKQKLGVLLKKIAKKKIENTQLVLCESFFLLGHLVF
jgi:hypothetical protein